MPAGGAQAVVRVARRRARRHCRLNAVALQRLEVGLLCCQRDQLVVGIADDEDPELGPRLDRGGLHLPARATTSLAGIKQCGSSRGCWTRPQIPNASNMAGCGT